MLLEKYCTSKKKKNAKCPPGGYKVTNESSKEKHFQIVAKVTTGFHLLFFMMLPLIMLILIYELYCVILDQSLI